MSLAVVYPELLQQSVHLLGMGIPQRLKSIRVPGFSPFLRGIETTRPSKKIEGFALTKSKK